MSIKVDPIMVQCGDIAEIAREVDCVVNASNPELTTGGGVAGGIHNMFGEYLEECAEHIHRVSTGSCVLMEPICIPKSEEADKALSKADVANDNLWTEYTNDNLWNWCRVMHTVAPRVQHPDWRFILERCYTGCLETVKEYNRGTNVSDGASIKSIAFPMLGTGAYGLPCDEADTTCFACVSSFLEEHYPDGGLEVRLVIGKYAKASDNRLSNMSGRVTRWLQGCGADC